MFYIFDKATGTKETGKIYPQCQKMSDGYLYNAPTSCWNLSWKQLPEFKPDLNYFLLEKKAKPTDVISAVSLSAGYLVSNRTKIILNQFNLPENKFYQAYIKHQTSILDNYNLFLYVSNISEYIDYESSEFQVLKIREVVEQFKVKNKSEFELKKSSLSPFLKIKAAKILFHNNIEPNYDMFNLGFDTNTYISHRLKTALEEAKITGIEIVPADVF